jgi:hypothetical protein
MEECLYEVQAIKNNSTKLIEAGHDVFTNDTKSISTSYLWCCREHIFEQFRLVIRRFHIRFNFHNNKIVSSNFPLENCGIERSTCELSTISVTWSSTSRTSCSLMQGNQVTAQRIREVWAKPWTMVSEAGEFAVTVTSKEIIRCEEKLFETNEGLFIRIDDTNIQSEGQKLSELRNLAKTTTEVALMSYIARELEDLMYQLYRKSWIDICRIAQQRQIWLKHMMKDPQQAYIAARMMLKTTSVMGHPAGQFLNVYECEQINNYYLALTTKCYASIPIHYKKYNKDHKRFLVPATMDIVLLDTEIPCTKPRKMFMKTINGKETYMWNGSTLEKSNENFTSIQLIEQVPNITYLHLMSSRIMDTTTQSLDTLAELTTATTEMLMKIGHLANIDIITLDTETLVHAASCTVSTVKASVTSVIDHIYPFIGWIYKLIVFGLIIAFIVMIFFLVIQVRNYMQRRKSKANIQAFLNTCKASKITN